ncbi:HNH endonuclease [Mycobacterium phage Plumbus]|uniref:HNH endonuclease n=2 Tax=Cheoctovirus TaxID=1623281 RepID=A0A7T3N3I0_9CAUD|nr:HNH endonuclease [Mycobacterium phage Kimberlium]YP_010113784.1 HNH endonuclease [Mycobacterium phage Plumbus]AKU43079.1 HNH endonuclease [Mycobacterium phage Kimberlium]QFR56836.1 HNH endonuclease [Mycobacterium phage Juice456]QPX62698.1 HNH endonuclease [Mycobacterium phage Plumbus]
MPFANTTVRNRRRAQVRQRDGDAPCALRITADCQALGGVIDYDARPPHPRSFEVDHIVSSVEAARLGWSQEDSDGLDNCQAVCRQCNRAKSSGDRAVPAVRKSYVNPRFA